ncbi:MAG: hypothetical protein IIZ73_04635 [Ruminococcus sp.]|nr:hypothetical protein [Ruminococcus sp.]
MYCIKCGVELADSEKKCPLCFTTVYHPELPQPEGEPLYPDNPPIKRQTVTRAGALFVITAFFLLGALLPMICDLSLNGGISWSGIVAAAVVLLYVLTVLPIWFRHPNAVVFLPCDHAACALFLLYICLFTDGKWFLSFALPTVGGSALITTAAVALCKYVGRGYLYIFGGMFMLTGGHIMLIEFLINLTFGVNDRLIWSFYPFAACFMIGLLLIIIAVSPKLRRSLQKRFFV